MENLLDTFQIEPAARAAALETCERQLKQWGVALPPAEPLVMDFGLGRFAEVGLFEFWIANEVKAGYCGKYMFLLDGQMCPRHSHQFKHETFFVVQGTMAVTLGDEAFDLAAGDTLAIEPGRIHSFAAKNGAALILELSMPCDPRDNLFVEPKTNAWLKANVSGAVLSSGV